MSLSPITSRLDHIDDRQLQRLISLWQAPPLNIDREAQRIARALVFEQQRRADGIANPENRSGTPTKLSSVFRWRFGRR
jgi:hypothetical protein